MPGTKFDGRKVGFRFLSPVTSLALTMAGVGVSLITESSIRTSGLARLPKLYLADEKLCTRTMYVAYPRNKYISKAASEFIRTLKAANA